MTTLMPSGLAAASNAGDTYMSWRAGSVVEYKPPSGGYQRWMPALITDVSQDGETLTVEFVMTGTPYQHSVPRSSELIARLGVHEQGLPPGFWARPSKTRRGQMAFADKVTGARYGSEELAWKVHLERVLRMEALPTVCDDSNAMANSKSRFTWPPEVPLATLSEEALAVHD